MDFSSWQGMLTTVLGLAVFTLIGVGIRVLMMMTIQQRRERMNRQINERLRTLIAAYRTLGGSFTGRLAVDPTHLRELRLNRPAAGNAGSEQPNQHEQGGQGEQGEAGNSDRSRRIRDAVEAALADIILLGNAVHVRLASKAASEMVAGRTIHTAELVVSLRDFIREALDLDPIPADVNILLQGPTRTPASSSRGKGDGERAGNKGGGGAADQGGGGGMGGGVGIAHGAGHGDDHASS